MSDATTSTPELDRSQPPPTGALRPYHFPTLERRTLPNGLRIVVCETRRFPVATLDLLLPAGAMAEADEVAGVASLTSGLLESGAGGRSAAEIAVAVDELGLSLDSGISWDITQAGFTCLTSRLDAGAAILADIVRRPDFPEHEVDRLRGQRLSTLAQNRADPSTLANEVALRSVYGPGVYGRPVGGGAGTVAGITRADVQAFHDARFLPAGATLVAAGDVSVDEVAELAERHFGDWTGAPEPVRPLEVRTRESGIRIVVAHQAGWVQSALRVAHDGPARSTPDYFALQVMNAILGGMFSSRLNMNLRERLGYTYGASSSFTMRRDGGPFAMATSVQTEVTAHAIQEMLADMRGMLDGHVTPKELADARTYLAGVFPIQVQTTDGVSAKLATLVTHGLPDDYWDHYREGIMDVTADDVLTVARRWLRPDAATIVVAGDADKVADPLRELGLGEVEVMDPATELP
jgi:zinc protease